MRQQTLFYLLVIAVFLFAVIFITACGNNDATVSEIPETEDLTGGVVEDDESSQLQNESQADEEQDEAEIDKDKVIEGEEQTLTLTVSSPTGDPGLPGHFDRADRYFNPTDQVMDLPKLSFDSKYLLGPYEEKLLLYSNPSRELLKIISFGESAKVRHFSWHPKNDAFICFVELNKETWIFLVTVNGEHELLQKLSEDKYPVWWVDWGHNGESFAFVYEGREESTLYLVDLSGETILETTIAECYGIRSPLVSPDGNKIYFVPIKAQTEDLWYWDLGNGQLEQVTKQNAGDYPFAWVNHNNLMVRLGAIGTGGGNLYGLSVIDVRSGNRSSSYYMVADSVDGPRKLSKSEPVNSWYASYILHSVSPGGHKVIGVDMDGNGSNPIISIIDLDSGNMQQLIKDAHFSQAVWATDASFYIVAEFVNGIKSSYTIYSYSMQSGLKSLIESEDQLYLVDIVQDQLQYLRQKDNLWFWETLKNTN